MKGGARHLEMDMKVTAERQVDTTSRMRKVPLVVALLALPALSMLVALPAYAGLDCPPGTVEKTDAPGPRCDPTVCIHEGQCRPDEVCRPIPLCIEIDQVDGGNGKDGGTYLVATQRCGPEKSCPTHQSCLESKRCVRKTVAAQIGLLAPAASATPASLGDAGATSAEAAKKGGCGCAVVGASDTGTPTFAALSGAAALLIVARGSRSRRDRSAARKLPRGMAPRTR